MPAQPARYAQLLGLEAGDDRLALLAEAGLACRVRGEYEEARRIYDGLALLAPNDPAGPLGLAEIAAAEGQWADTERHAKAAMHAWHCDRESLIEAARLRGRALLMTGRRNEAERFARIAVDLSPSSVAESVLLTVGEARR